MKFFIATLFFLLIGCGHNPASRQIASSTPLIKALLKAVAKEASLVEKMTIQEAAEKLLFHLKNNADEYGLSSSKVRAWKSLDDIPEHLQKSLHYEFITRAPKIFKLNKQAAENVLKDIKLSGNKVSPLQEKIFISNSNGRRIMGRKFERELILSVHNDNEAAKKAIGSLFDNLTANATNSTEMALSRQIVNSVSELRLKTGFIAVPTDACKKVGGSGPLTTLNSIVARFADDAEKGLIKSENALVSAFDEEIQILTKRTPKEAKFSRCALAGRSVAGQPTGQCRVLNPKIFAIDCK